MIRIGIVGDIGSGKSYVAKQFGFPIFDADFEVNKIYKKNRKCFKKLKRAFPKHILSFPIKRKELFQVIEKNKNNIKKIISLLHFLLTCKIFSNAGNKSDTADNFLSVIRIYGSSICDSILS